MTYPFTFSPPPQPWDRMSHDRYDRDVARMRKAMTSRFCVAPLARITLRDGRRFVGGDPVSPDVLGCSAETMVGLVSRRVVIEARP